MTKVAFGIVKKISGGIVEKGMRARPGQEVHGRRQMTSLVCILQAKHVVNQVAVGSSHLPVALHHTHVKRRRRSTHHWQIILNKMSCYMIPTW